MLIKVKENLCSRLQTSQKGFTLVEMMMAMVASSIVLIGIAVIVAGSHKYIINGRSKSKLQQDYSLIAQVLSNKIRGGLQGQHKIYTEILSKLLLFKRVLIKYLPGKNCKNTE